MTLADAERAMGKPKLTYFDFDGGRGEVPRIALTLGDIDFEDDRVAFADWQARKKDMPFGAMPVLEVDGKRVAQSNTINRYVGKLAGLYPTDAWQAALCDEAMDAVEDIAVKIVPTFDMADSEKKTAREALAAGPIPFFLHGLETRLEANGGRYFADNHLTVADLCYCTDCRKTSAAGHAAMIGFAREAIAVNGEIREYRSKADSGAEVMRGFCPTCGAGVTSNNDRMPHLIFLRASTLDDPNQFAAQLVVYASRAPSWDPVAEGVPAFAEGPPG